MHITLEKKDHLKFLRSINFPRSSWEEVMAPSISSLRVSVIDRQNSSKTFHLINY